VDRHRLLLVAVMLAAGCIIHDVDFTGHACDDVCPAPWQCTAAHVCEHDPFCSGHAGATSCLDFDDGTAPGWRLALDDGGRGGYAFEGQRFHAMIDGGGGTGSARLGYPVVAPVRLDFDLGVSPFDTGSVLVLDLGCPEAGASVRWLQTSEGGAPALQLGLHGFPSPHTLGSAAGASPVHFAASWDGGVVEVTALGATARVPFSGCPQMATASVGLLTSQGLRVDGWLDNVLVQ
jgi:hypothetical protein